MGASTEIANRARNARWCAEHRNCKRLRPWLAGAPPYDAHLPGMSMAISLDPLPRWPIELRNTRALHGMVTELSGVPHQRWPQWVLRPWQSGWAVHWMHARGFAFAGRTVDAVLFDRPTRVTFGPGVRLRSPQVARRGHARIRLDTITPVARAADGRTVPEVRPSRASMVNTCGDFARRIAPSDRWYEWVKDRIELDVVDIHTEPAHVPLGEKYGVVHGWQGSVDLDANAVARWLLISASRMLGFGSRVAFGFGCIRVTEAT